MIDADQSTILNVLHILKQFIEILEKRQFESEERESSIEINSVSSHSSSGSDNEEEAKGSISKKPALAGHE